MLLRLCSRHIDPSSLANSPFCHRYSNFSRIRQFLPVVLLMATLVWSCRLLPFFRQRETAHSNGLLLHRKHLIALYIYSLLRLFYVISILIYKSHSTPIPLVLLSPESSRNLILITMVIFFSTLSRIGPQVHTCRV